MVTDRVIAEQIENGLNAVAVDFGVDFRFKIYPSMGDYLSETGGTQRTKATPLINGVLLSFPSQIVPLQGVKAYTQSQMLTILAPTTEEEAEKGIGDILNVVRGYVQGGAGQVGEITDEQGVSFAYALAPQLPQVGNLSHDIGFWYIPVSIMLTWEFIANGKLSNAITISIDGTPAIITSGGIVRTRVADMSNRESSEELQGVIGQQGLTIKAIIPFTTDGVGAKLVRDMLVGSLSVTYLVEYDDGVTKTESNTNPSWTMVATEIAQNLAAGTIASISATFVIAASDVYGEASNG